MIKIRNTALEGGEWRGEKVRKLDFLGIPSKLQVMAKCQFKMTSFIKFGFLASCILHLENLIRSNFELDIRDLARLRWTFCAYCIHLTMGF